MRKKIVNILAVATVILLFDACDESGIPSLGHELSDYPVVFTSGIGTDVSVTRSSLVNEFPENAQVGMYMYCLAQNGQAGNSPWETKKLNSLPDSKFDNVPLTYASGVWTYSPLTYWYEEADYLYSFFAYYPYDVGVENNSGAGIRVLTEQNGSPIGDPVLTYTLPFSNGTESTERDMNEVTDVLYSNKIDHLNTGIPVDMTFYHLLTGLEFEVDNYNESATVTITGLRLKGTFHRSVSLSLNEPITASGQYSGYFSIIAGGHSQEFPANTSQQTVMIDGGSEPAELMLVADYEDNTITGGRTGGCSIDISYSINGNSYTRNDLAVPVDQMTFRPGVKNIISLEFLGNNLALDFRAGDHWIIGGDDEIIFQ